ncbi:MAG TPA: isoprenylcysteine carboxylmethyltransferase family protein [Thermoanaerobaculia bacterium]|nr:isoprenylcysteine carboxylmethyltransferase family protein [Thermoanaerobaculia bacterium]
MQVLQPQTLIDQLFTFAWGAWFASWMLASFWRSRAVNRPPVSEQATYRVLTIAGALLLLTRFHSDIELWPRSEAVGWPMLAIAVAGFLFTWWARIHLGSLWSGTVTRKADHRVVDSGPYRIVRHPIYTGLTAASFATGFYRGTVLAIAGAALLMLSFYVKARLEERFLRQELGEDYNRYAAHVRMLIPFIFLALACTHAPKPAAQNPSPMIDFTRAHERLLKKTIDGEQLTINKAEVLITPAAAAAKEGDLLIHFHGSAWLPFEAALMTNRPLVVAVVNVGQGGGIYDRAFSDPAAFDSLVAQIRSRIKVDRVFLSGFSAGYGAVRAILRNRASAVDGILLLDGLHTSYAGNRQVDAAAMQPFLDFAKSGKRFVFSHSEIFPGTFASTTETADWLIAQLGLKRTPVLKWGPRGMQQLSEVRSGNLLIMGFAGNSAPDHIDQFHSMPEFLELLLAP